MVTKEDKWVRIFDIPDVSKHKKGFTIYKVISMLYPENCPDAITKITVWKRYNDFKKLHRELKSLHRSLKIREKLPSLPSSTFFSRFDDEVIQERRQMILNFLEFISAHSQLFTSNCFVKFFETSHTPCTMLNSSINSIRADLNLPSEPEYLSFHSPESDDEKTMSDTDSVSTMSSLSSSIHIDNTFVKSSQSLTEISKKLSELSVNSTQIPKNSEEVTEVMSNNILCGLMDTLSEPANRDCVSFSNSMNSDLKMADDVYQHESGLKPLNYVDEADKYIIIGTRYEEDKKYEDAFVSYKQGISILLQQVKGDRDLDRRHLVKYKIEKYLLRAEKIYNMHLSTEFTVIPELPKKEALSPQPLSDLYKYKVIRVIGSGMLVLHSESQQLYFVKVIHKTTICNAEDLIIPTDVPFMIEMRNFYNCDNAVFLVLEYCSGLKFWDYIKQKRSKTADKSYKQYQTKTSPESDNESECSFSELVNEYSGSAYVPPTLTSYDKDEPETKDDNNMNNLDLDDILIKSQELIVSVNEALKRNAELKKAQQEVEDFEVIDFPTSKRKFSESSCTEDCEVEEFNDLSIEKVVKWTAQLVLALERLHQEGVICSDLNSNNILIDGNDDLVLTYMCKINERRVFHYQINLTLAPEVYRYEDATPAADWFSLGTILYEMLVGVPINETHPEGILSYTTLKIPKFVSGEGRSLLKQLLYYDPEKRLGSGLNGTDAIKSHPFFNTIRWDTLMKSA